MTQLTIAARYSGFMVEHDVGGMAYRLTEYWYVEPREHGNTSPIVIKHEYDDVEHLINKINSLESLEFKQERELSSHEV